MDWIQIVSGFFRVSGICAVLSFARKTGAVYGHWRRPCMDGLSGGGPADFVLRGAVCDCRNCSGFLYGNYGECIPKCPGQRISPWESFR